MWAVFAIWLVFCVWVVGYCKLRAYQLPGEELTTVLGMPAWVFWGVAVPWCAATIVSILFASFIMKDHRLEEPTASANSIDSHSKEGANV
jgi:hypothetical protein